jgi:hypothetical protein
MHIRQQRLKQRTRMSSRPISPAAVSSLSPPSQATKAQVKFCSISPQEEVQIIDDDATLPALMFT